MTKQYFVLLCLFCQKVVSIFHLNQDIVLLDFLPGLSHQKTLPCAHQMWFVLSRCIGKCLQWSSSQAHCSSLLKVLGRVRRTTKSTISQFICQPNVQAYGFKCKVPPFQVKAYSTKSVAASWAIYKTEGLSQQEELYRGFPVCIICQCSFTSTWHNPGSHDLQPAVCTVKYSNKLILQVTMQGLYRRSTSSFFAQYPSTERQLHITQSKDSSSCVLYSQEMDLPSQVLKNIICICQNKKLLLVF